ncbi:MAG: DUF1566 domain-containing protein [Campylobacterota bacterium]|nr:DUF1566 domain-containing protein [Campylobacterota bacterium]
MKQLLLFCISFNLLIALPLKKIDNSIIDYNTKLLWQDTISNTQRVFTHKEAIHYCKNLKLRGFTGWRLPTVDEYKTIVDTNREDDKPKVKKVFEHVIAEYYWTNDRTWVRNFGLYSYYIFFKSGTFYYQNRTYQKYVKCVHTIN